MKNKIVLPAIIIHLLIILVSASNMRAQIDTIPVSDRDERTYFEQILSDDFRRQDEIHLVRTVEKSTQKLYNYQILKNSISVWELTISSPADDLEEVFVRWCHNSELDDASQEAIEVNRGSYRATPWLVIPPIYREDSLSQKLLDLFAWESGGEANFTRNHLYNLFGSSTDTIEIAPNLTKPAIYDYRMDLDYRHRLFKYLWIGGGIERSWQQSHRFDTLQVDREGWFKRMGWNLSIAVPGFKYELFRDPGIVPFYGQYEDSLYTKLYPDAKYLYLEELNIVEDSVALTVIDSSGFIHDTSIVYTQKNRIRSVGGVGQRFSIKIAYFNYTLTVQSNVHKAPIQTFMMENMPFFKGEWDMGLLVIPNGQVIPHLKIDFYRTSIPLGGAGVLGISPFNFELELWDRRNYYISFGFNIDFLMGEATFQEE